MSNFKADLAAMLRSIRLARGDSQQAVADRLGIQRSTYTYYETGKTLPSITTLRRLAEIFEAPPEYFFYPEKYLVKAPGQS